MKILFLTRSYYPNIGGVEKHIWQISKELIKKGYKVKIIAEKPSQNINLLNYKNNGEEVIFIPSIKENKLKKYFIWINLFKYINEIRQADIIHCHDVFYWYLPFRFIFINKKIYTTFHGYEGNNIPNFKAKFMHKIAEKLSRGNICVGNFFRKWYNTNPTYVIFGGIDKQKINIKKINAANKAMYLGRLEEEAGIMAYLKAMKILKDQNNELSLDVYGNGSQLKKAIQFVNKYKLKVNFKGFVYDVEKFLPNYSYVFVSRYLGILEAIAAKKPIFAVYNNEIKKDYLEMTPFSKNIFICKDGLQISNSIKVYLINKNTFNYSGLQSTLLTWGEVTNVYLNLWKI